MDRIKSRVVSAISGNILIQSVNSLIQVAGIPILLKYWGINYYGEWLLLFTIPSYIAMSDMGLGSSATSELAMLVQAKRDIEAKETLRNTFWFILIIGGIPFLLLGLSLLVLPWYDWLKFSAVDYSDFNIAFFFLLLYIYLALFLTLPLGYYRVRQIYHRERVISSIFRVFEFFMIVVVIVAGYKIVMVAFIYFIVRLIQLIFVLFDLSRKFQEFKLLPFGYDFSRIRHLLKPGLSAMTIYIGQNIMLQGIVSIIGIGLGSAALVLFSTLRTLVNVVKQVVSIVNYSIISEFSYAYGAMDIPLLRRIFKLANVGNTAIAFLMLAGLYLFGSSFVNIWTNGKVSVIEPFFTFILIGTFFNALWNLHLMLLVSTNKLRYTGLWFLIMSVTLIIINGMCINDYGINGVAVSMLIFEIIMLLVMTKASKRILAADEKTLSVL